MWHVKMKILNLYKWTLLKSLSHNVAYGLNT